MAVTSLLSYLKFNDLPLNEDKTIDYSKDLFGKQAFITGSGQLHGETYAMAFGDIYTFGPTFRTENSNTKTHANEFWMIEPEMAFCDLEGNMDVMEKMLERLEQIEHRLAVLEGEGKKDDDEMEDITSGDALAARYNKLYAKLAQSPIPCPAPVVATTKQSEVARAKASFEKFKQQININDYLK